MGKFPDIKYHVQAKATIYCALIMKGHEGPRVTRIFTTQAFSFAKATEDRQARVLLRPISLCN